jgi:glycosyltransferase involved in cell wall biosynthesis
MRVLHFTPMYAPAWRYGGVVRSTTLLCETLVKLGHHVTVATTTAGTDHERSGTTVQLERNGVGVIYVPFIRTPLGVDAPVLNDILDCALRKHDVLHLTAVWQPTGRRAHAAATRRKKPYIVSPRGALSPFSFSHGSWKKIPYWSLVERRIASDASMLHSTSPLEEQELCRLLPCQSVATVPNAVDAALWSFSPSGRQAWRSRHRIAADEFVVMHVGRVEPKKNVEFLVEAMRIAADKCRLTLAIVGSALKPRHEAQLASRMRGFPCRVVRVADTPDAGELAAAYSAADVLAMPSRHENFGNVLLEALLCETPVLASTNVGAAFLAHDLPGTSILPLDVIAWGQALTRLQDQAGHTETRGRVPVAIRSLLAARFSPRATAAGIAGLYEKVLRDN